METPAVHNTDAFFRVARSGLKFRLFLLTRLPAAYFSGVRITSIDEKSCATRIPFKWFTKNPFRSTYFACLAMAAEMSTGALALAFIYRRKPAISMLVVNLEAAYFKKATGITHFICEDGIRFSEAVRQTIETGEAVTVRASSVGRDENGEKVAEFFITWSFKAKQERKLNS